MRRRLGDSIIARARRGDRRSSLRRLCQLGNGWSVGDSIMVQVNTASVRLHRYLVISTYLTTLLACVCLVFAELSLMPEIVFFAILGAMALAVAYGLEGHWTLSLRRANVLAVLIAVFLAIWAVYQNLRPSAGLLRQIPWPTSLLPYLG